MKILSLASRVPFTMGLLVFLAIIFFRTKRAESEQLEKSKSFWSREIKANSIRRKSLDALPYIIIPFDKLPMDICNDDATILKCIEEIRALADKKIVNFTGYTNTDLKMEFGAPNITALMEYDSNFTDLSRLLEQWSSRLYDLEQYSASMAVCEFAVRVRCDISGIFYRLADIYVSTGNDGKLPWLKQNATLLNSAMKPIIIENLNKRYPDIDEADSVHDIEII